LSRPAQLVSYAPMACAGALPVAFQRTADTRPLARRLNRPHHHAFTLLAVLGLAFAAFLLPLPHGWSAGWRGELTNRMHAPLMGLCFAAMAALFHRWGAANRWRLLAAATAIAVMAALVEWVQPWFGRTASLEDFLWGMAGVVGGWLWQVAGARLILRLVAVVCMFGPPLVWYSQVALIQAEAHRLFPVLADGTHPRLQTLWTIEPVQLGAAPDSLLLARDADHPASFHLDTLHRDWSDFGGLEIDGALQAAAAVEIGVRLDLDDTGKSRLRAGGWMQPGSSQIEIYWAKDVPTPRVHQLVVFLAAHPTAAKLQLHRLRLIPRPKNTDSRPDEPHDTKIKLSGGLQGAGSAQ
jgi:hypothetical protein